MSQWAAQGVAGAFDEVVTAARESPLVVALGVVGLLVLLVVVWWFVSWLRRPPGERLRRVLAEEEEVAILMHPNPDPDAMSCAMATAALAEDGDTESTLHYPGQIRHQENRAFTTVLDLDFDKVETAADLPDKPIVLVDHNEPRGFTGAADLDPLAVVDHHPGDGSGEAFTDVRTRHGSCASIFAEYFDDLGWTPVDPEAEVDEEDIEERELPSDVATALLYGIQSDTKQLTKGCSPAEFRAAEFLYEGVDEELLDRIANPQVDAEVLDVKARAISQRDIKGAFAISDVGAISNVDAIPQAADELTRLEGVTAVVVFGEKEGTLHLSGRSRDDRVHMGRTLETVVEQIPMSEAGGHARMGGGQISTEHMDGLSADGGSERGDLVERLFAAMSGDI